MADQALKICQDYFNENYPEFITEYLKKEDICDECDSLLITTQPEADLISITFLPEDKEHFPALQFVQFYYFIPDLIDISQITPTELNQFINYINGTLPIGFYVSYKNSIILRHVSTLPAKNIESNMDMLRDTFKLILSLGQLYNGIIQQLFKGGITFEEAIRIYNNAL